MGGIACDVAYPSDLKLVELVILFGIALFETIVLAHLWLGKSFAHAQLVLFCSPLTMFVCFGFVGLLLKTLTRPYSSSLGDLEV